MLDWLTRPAERRTIFFEALSLKASISEADSRYRIVHMPELVWGSPETLP
jgi:hypothetical protein